MTRTLLLVIVWACCLPARAGAEVLERSPGGFSVKTTVTIAAAPDDVFRALVQEIGMWWDPAHTFSGNAANLRIDLRPGGCFCETLSGGGGVQHAVVVNVVPGELLRLSGALGPLQGTGVTGALTWQLAGSAEGGVTASVSYIVGGYYPGGLDAIAAPVDTVVGGQLRRLKAHLEAGRR